MKLHNLMVAFAISLFSLSALAQSSGPASIVERGLNAYLKEGPTAALQGFLKGSALEGNAQAMSQANGLRQIEDLYGKPESYHIVRTNAISPKTAMVVAALNFQKGVVFIRVQAYLTVTGEWVSTEFRFATDGTTILPPELLFGK